MFPIVLTTGGKTISVLGFTYTNPNLPAVTTASSTAIQQTSAVGNGTITTDGGSSLIEKIANVANIDTTSSSETAISFVIGVVLLLVGNTVYDKVKRINKD